MDNGVGRPPAAAVSGPAVQCQHFLPCVRHARLFRAVDRTRPDGRAAAVARRFACPGIQRRAHRGVRAQRLGHGGAHRVLDRKSSGRPAGRVDVCVQYAYADAPRTHPGHSHLGAAPGAPRGGPDHHANPRARCDLARRLDVGDGLYIRIPACVRERHDRGRPRRPRRRLGPPSRARPFLVCALRRAGDRRLASRLHPLSPRRPRPGHGTLARQRRGILGNAEGLSRLGGTDPFLHVERRVLPRPRGLLFSRCHRAGARRARALAVVSSSRTGGRRHPSHHDAC